MFSTITRKLAMAAALALSGAATSHAAETRVAVAADFTEAAKEIAASFEDRTGHKVLLSFGATGHLYQQITEGADFEVFIAADIEFPRRAEDEGLAVPGSRMTYAIGRIVLWSKTPGLVTDGDTLKSGGFSKIAIANPKTAPYGLAAVEAMTSLGVYDDLKPKILRGKNVAATHDLIVTGKADLGIIALSEIRGEEGGSRWIVPHDLYKPILQEAVLLEKGAANPTARAFLEFLKGPEATRIIHDFGYGTE